MMTKFVVISNEPSKGMDGYTVVLRAAETEPYPVHVYNPLSVITLSSITEKAASRFVVGEELSVTFWTEGAASKASKA